MIRCPYVPCKEIRYSKKDMTKHIDDSHPQPIISKVMQFE